MLRIIKIIIICGIVLSLPFIGYAGTVGNPASPNSLKGAGVFSLKQDKKLAIQSTLDVEFLFDRDIHANAASGTELTSGEWYMAGLSCTLFNRVAPYVKLGMAHLKVKWTELGQEEKLESDSEFAWALGGKVLIWEFDKPKVKIVGDGFYRVANLGAKEGWSGGSRVSLDTAKSRFLIREWQLALLAATDIDLGDKVGDSILGVSKVVPYAGGKYSGLNGRIREVMTNGDFHNPGVIKADRNFGVFVGCDFVGPTDSVLLSLEGRFIDETAMTVGLAVLF